ncbi:MAG: sugar ABC transporter substrate-binding protein [Proteobacteria bacterium]|nr:sugar ABC transporter substrate-binding protein [Pseudomonadota bacterium]
MRRTHAALLLVLLAVSGCGGHRDVTELRFWAMGRESEVLAALLPDFEREHPGLRVRIEQLPWTAAHEKLLTAVAGDATPDLCQLGNTWIPELVALRALEPLDARLAATPAIDRADYFEGIWQTNLIREAAYGVPWYVDTRLLFYRSDLLHEAGFAEPPRSWAEWRQVLAAIAARSHGERFGVLLPLNEFEPLLALALQQPEPLLADGGLRGNFTNPGFERTLDFYVGMFRDHYAPPVGNAQIANVWTEFGKGYFTFYISGPWNIGEFQRRLPPELTGRWMTAPLPGPEGPGASIAGGASLSIFRRSRHQAEAWQLIEYLSRPAVQQRFHQLTGDLPPRRSAWAAPALAQDPFARAFRDQLERARPTPRVPEWEQIVTEMRIVAERVVRGEFTVHEGAVELNARADRILAKRRELAAEGKLL